ncbi:MAG: aldo/keto reductase [Oscillospiraceae bacterium]|nr:aldo/keto reductase [Oscillospiraceae bacterium]
MDYRKFGRTDLSPSVLGFGMMRLKTNEDGTIDENWAIKTLRYAIDHGLSYVDTAYAYPDSERVTGLCLQDGYREKVTLATKLPVVKLTCEEDFETILDEQLRRLQTDHIDVYLLHALNLSRWEEYVKKYNILAHAEKARAKGKIRYLGFSFHDSLDAFKTILNGYDKWDFCQIQLNYMDTHYQAGLEGLQLAHENGLAVVIMEPLRGGTLANVPEQVAKMLPKNPVESALDFLWNMKEVNVVLSGMNEMQQVEQNLSYAENARPGMLTESENQAILAAGDAMRAVLSVPCTGCNYCSTCPNEIAIPDIFKINNQRQLDGNYSAAKAKYQELGKKNAQACVSCGLCEEQCPQQIPVYHKLAEIHKMYA